MWRRSTVEGAEGAADAGGAEGEEEERIARDRMGRASRGLVSVDGRCPTVGTWRCQTRRLIADVLVSADAGEAERVFLAKRRLCRHVMASASAAASAIYALDN